MANIVRFVNAISAAPTTLLDLNKVIGPFMVDAEGIDLSPPPIRRSIVSGFLSIDGDPVTATAAGNRVIKLPLRLVNVTAEGAATALQQLSSQLSTDGILMLQLDGMTQPVFFSTYAAPDYTLKMLRLMLATNSSAQLEIPAMPYGFGPKITLPTVTVFNDPTRNVPLNLNPYFEVDVSDWSAGGATFVRSTAQFHEGAASGLMTPDGVTVAPQVNTVSRPATVNNFYRGVAWVRCAVARNVDIRISWRDAGDAQLSETTATVAVGATTWTPVQVTGQAPVSTTQARVRIAMTGTPPAAHTLHVDEAILFKLNSSPSGGPFVAAGPSALIPGGMCFDVAGVLGDVETPLFLSLVPNLASTPGVRRSAIAVRRRGIPPNLEWFTEAADMLLANGATGMASDATASGPTVWGAGGGTNFVRIDFTATPALTYRIYGGWPGALTSVLQEVRGTYSVYARVRHATAGDTFTAQLRWGTATAYGSADAVTIPAATAGTTNWFYVPLGLLPMPPGYDPETDGYSNTPLPVGVMTVWFLFARLTGTGTLDVDHFLFLPADDRLALIDWHASDAGLASVVLDGRRNAIYALDNVGGVCDMGPRSVAGGFPMVSPGVTNRIYFVRDVNNGPVSRAGVVGGTGDILSDSTVITPYYWPRYRVIRPAAT